MFSSTLARARRESTLLLSTYRHLREPKTNLQKRAGHVQTHPLRGREGTDARVPKRVVATHLFIGDYMDIAITPPNMRVGPPMGMSAGGMPGQMRRGPSQVETEEFKWKNIQLKLI
ncbi:hypothetical protein B566_EDAN007263 [Ephemera danica]|nr:hypothetical protein B566_EDAN007263 [Ephemera danica]